MSERNLLRSIFELPIWNSTRSLDGGWRWNFTESIQCSSEVFELRIRVLCARILRICVCLYAHIRTYIRAYMSLCYACPQVPLCEALFDKQRTVLEWKSARLQLEICIVWKMSMKAQIFRVLRHKFTDKLPFINNCLIFSCQKVSRKIENCVSEFL